jgi:hypothetical protein
MYIHTILVLFPFNHCAVTLYLTGHLVQELTPNLNVLVMVCWSWCVGHGGLSIICLVLVVVNLAFKCMLTQQPFCALIKLCKRHYFLVLIHNYSGK